LAAANRKPDRRTLKTRAALLSVFRELVLSHGYTNVTVGDIIHHANIGRSTFYLHFSSKLDLLKHSLDRHCTTLASCVDANVAPGHLVPLLGHYREQRHRNAVFFEEPIRSIWVRRLAHFIEQKLREHPRLPRERHLLPRSLVAWTIAEMQIAMIIYWLRSAGAVTLERFAGAILSNTRALLPSGRSAAQARRGGT
jgi:AcrR family transcriptional regulator